MPESLPNIIPSHTFEYVKHNSSRQRIIELINYLNRLKKAPKDLGVEAGVVNFASL
jgi:hypothetical protein